MASNVDIDIVLDKGSTNAVILGFERLGKQSRNLSPAFRQIANDLVKSHQINFRSHGTRFGEKWAPRKRMYKWAILEKTGKMSHSFRGKSDSNSAEVTNTVSYAKWHQLGTRRLPVRNLIGLAGDGGRTDLNDALKTIRKHLRVGDS